MRIAAGILMIMYGVKMIGFLVGSLSEWGFHGYLDARSLFVIISAVFIITGGVFCLKRKYWKICFASSIVLLVFMIFDLFPTARAARVSLGFLNIPYWVVIPLFPPWGILPLIFICLRRSEWQEISA